MQNKYSPISISELEQLQEAINIDRRKNEYKSDSTYKYAQLWYTMRRYKNETKEILKNWDL